MNEIPEIFKKADTLFHYCKTSVAIENILYEKQLRLTSRKKSIDPIENIKPQISDAIAAYPKEIERLEKETQKDAEKIKQNINSRIDNIRQVCFCMNGTLIEKNPYQEPLESFGFIKPRMWDQYGNGYKGVCLAFSKEKLLKNEKIELEGKVNYLKYEQLEKPYLEIDRNILNEKRYKKYNDYLLNFVDEILFRKHKDYKGENEYRICTLTEKEYDYINIEECIVGIIVSLKDVNKYTREKFRKYSKKMKIDLIDISWKSNAVSCKKDLHIPPFFETIYS